MDSSEETRKPASNLVLWLILGICLLPIVASTLLYFVWTPREFVNYGELVGPVALAETSVEQIDGGRFAFAELAGRWVLLSIDDGSCDEYCREKLYLMRQIRLTQGKNAPRIERVWFIDGAQKPEPALLSAHEGLHDVVIGLSPVLEKFPGGANRSDYLYVIDPLGNLMMRYPRDADPNRMKKDISRLLRLSSGWRQIQR